MSNIHKYYTLLGILALASVGTFFYFSSKHSEALKLSEAKDRDLKDFHFHAGTIYEHKKISEFLNNKGGATGTNNLNTSVILQLTQRFKLKDPSNFRSSGTITRPKHLEETHRFSLKNEYLENIINFLLAIERIDNTKIENITLMRTKEKDRWNANDISAVRILAKEDE